MNFGYWVLIIGGGYAILYLAFRQIDKNLLNKIERDRSKLREALIQAHVENIDHEWEKINRP